MPAPPLDLSPLWARAFLAGEAREANALIQQAREAFASLTLERGGVIGDPFSYEVVVPEVPEDADPWFGQTFLPRLIYHCETRRAPLPECGAVFVSAFVGERLHCVAASEVIAFATGLLELEWETLVERHGTGEVRHALRPGEGDAADDAGSDTEIKALLPGRSS